MIRILLFLVISIASIAPSHSFDVQEWLGKQKWAQDLDLVKKESDELKIYTEEDTIDLLKDPRLVSEQLKHTAKIETDRSLPRKIKKLPAHRVAIHISDDDPKKLKIALNNIQNLNNAYKKTGHILVAEIVAYGPGIKLFHPESHFSSRIQKMKNGLDFFQISACKNSLRNIYERTDVPMMTGVKKVGSGVIRLVQLQENGYTYIKP